MIRAKSLLIATGDSQPFFVYFEAEFILQETITLYKG